MNHVRTHLCAAALLALASQAQAGFFSNETGLTAPDQTITFESAVLLPNQGVTDEFSAFGVVFSGAHGNSVSSATDPIPHTSGNRITNFVSSLGISGEPFTMTFAQTLSQAAFALGSANGVATISALLGGVVVETETAPSSPTNETNYFGFTDISFDQIVVSMNSADHAFLIDNLQTSVAAPVPEPETWALMLAGLAAAGVSRRRRQER